MIKAIYLQTWEILKKIPVKLWGVSLLSGVLGIVASLFAGIPILGIALGAAISAGMCAVYYAAYKGGEADTSTLFAPFKDWKTFKRVAGGMCWMYLFLFLWFLIPIAGPFLAIYKSLQYKFTPYILTQEPTVSGRQALKKSIEDTKGYKGNMLVAEILPAVAYNVVAFILSLLALIPFVGILFGIIQFLLGIAWMVVAPLFFGLVDAGFYDYGKKPAYVPPSAPSAAPAPTPVIAPAPETPAEASAPAETAAPAENAAPAAMVTCQTCGTENTPDKKFCTKCGAKL